MYFILILICLVILGLFMVGLSEGICMSVV